MIKANAKQDKLAERIVAANDTEGMERSNIMIFDYLPHAQGTICEMGYAQRIKKVRRILRFMFNALTLDKGQDIFRKNKIVQSSVSINILYGVIMDITDGRGIKHLMRDM